MPNQSTFPRVIELGVAAAALCIFSAGTAFAQSPVAAVAIFPDHYVYAGRSYNDLDRLEDAVIAAHPGGVRLEACGNGTARALGAAVHRFRNLYLDLRFSYVDDAVCSAASAAPVLMPVSQRFGLRPYGINDEAVDHWWHTVSFP